MSDDADPNGASEEPIDADAIGWDAVEPPAGFAERTAAAFLDGDDEAQAVESSASRSPWGRAWLGAAAALAAAALLLWLWPRGGEASRDELRAHGIETAQLGSRAIAVAQPGAVLRWEVDADGTTRVEQDRGRVFYRVDEGGAFDVQTPAGTVTVTGTCFEVETDEMNGRAMKSGAIGAALAAAVVVTVYEGRVVLANERGEVEVTPGQQARADASVAPHRFDGDSDFGDDSPEAVAARVVAADDAVAQVARQARALEAARVQGVAQEEEIERLRPQVRELGGEEALDGPEAAKRRAKRCAGTGRGGHDAEGCSFLEPDQETLLEMARCATVKIDFPGFLTDPDPPQVDGYVGQLGVSDPGEMQKIQAAADAHYAEFHRELRGIFVELGGDPAVAEEASAKTLKSFIEDQLDREMMGDVQRIIAEERAGLREPPPPGAEIPIEQRAFRLVAELGNDFERHLADELGSDRARELRRIQDGWPGSTSVHSGDCRD